MNTSIDRDRRVDEPSRAFWRSVRGVVSVVRCMCGLWCGCLLYIVNFLLFVCVVGDAEISRDSRFFNYSKCLSYRCGRCFVHT